MMPRERWRAGGGMTWEAGEEADEEKEGGIREGRTQF